MKTLPRFGVFLVAIILVCQALLLANLARLDAQTTDESVHLSSGYSYLKYHDFRFSPEHPPLVRMLAAAPLFALHTHDVHDPEWFRDHSSNFFYDTWRESRWYGEELLYKAGNNAEVMLWYGRLAIVGLTAVLGFLIFWLAKRWWGWWAGLLALAVFSFDSNILAHGHLVTTDIGAALGYLLGLAAIWQFLRAPTWKHALWLGGAISLAQMMKFTTIMLFPVGLILGGWYLWQRKIRWSQIKRHIPKLLVAGLVGWVIIAAVYQFQLTPAPYNPSLSQTIQSLNGYHWLLPAQQQHWLDVAYNVGRLVMVPRDFFKGELYVVLHSYFGHDSYLFGHYSKTGWWYYFLVIFLVKTPISTLLLTLIAVVVVVTQKRLPHREVAIYFLTASGLYLVFAMLSRADLGLRHILPMYPPLFVAIGAVIGSSQTRWLKISGLGLLGLLLIETAVAYPYYISFFNAAVGGPWQGYKITADSSLDWGQDLKRIQAYVQAHPQAHFQVIYTWDGQPSLAYYRLSDLEDNANTIIINITALNSPEYRWLKTKPVLDRITPSVFVIQR